jgi:hypothetical protein
LKKLATAHRALAELKGIAAIPNEGILLDTLPLQEAKDSSAVENIITTHDELYQAELQLGESQAAKEVQRYAATLRLGLGLVQDRFTKPKGYLFLDCLSDPPFPDLLAWQSVIFHEPEAHYFINLANDAFSRLGIVQIYLRV